eukprot:jgi/Chrzof1/13782/Cz08g12080.t1
MPRANRPPARLSRQQLTYYAIGLPMAVIALSVGIAGLFIVLDDQLQRPISNSSFGVLWRKAVQHNPFIQAFMVNFGAIGVLFSTIKLLGHRKALQEERRRAAAVQAAAAVAAEDRKDQ